MTKYKEILRLANLGINQSGIASSCGCARKTVRDVLSRAKELRNSYPLDEETSDADLQRLLFPEKSVPTVERKYPDYEYIDKEMMRSGVTVKLLWSEYCEVCRQTRELPLMYSQFCFHYQKYRDKTKATMHILRKPGEQTEVDWAGKTIHIVDSDTGEPIPCYVFVGVLNYSLYAYVEAFFAMDMESWINAHVNMYRYFCGSTRILIPDNLKTGVDRADWYTPKINKTYQEMAQHYNVAVLPARVRSPKDKASVENTVGIISTWITAALRNERFFSLEELNREMRKRLDIFNRKPFQKKEGSRYSVYLADEKPFLTPLPSAPFELSQWKQATVQFNYHISIEKMQYSVPYEYIKQIVDVRLTKTTVEVFYHNQRICSHKRLYGHPGQYSTIQAHMPEDHQKYLEWNGDRFIQWGQKIGPNTAVTIKSILDSYKAEQQGYKACIGVLKLADKYGVERLEAACRKALVYTPRPSYKSVKNILSTGQDKMPKEQSVQATTKENSKYGFTRGAEYYGGKNDDK